MRRPCPLFFAILLFSLISLSKSINPLEYVLSDAVLNSLSTDDNYDADSSDWDDFGDSNNKSEEDLDPGSWRPIFEHQSTISNLKSNEESRYYSGVRKMIESVTSGDPGLMEESASEIEAAAVDGFPHAQSTLGFLYGKGQSREQSEVKAFLYHKFASDGGNMQSKMALAYIYLRQDMIHKALKLYAELAEASVSSFAVLKNFNVIGPVRLHKGSEENKGELRKLRGEEDEEFQILEYQAQRGNADAMYKVGLFYYFGLRAVKLDHAKAFSWFLKAAEKGEPMSMEVLGEMYSSGAGVERNYTKALEWLTLASKHQYFSAYNGIGYMYVKGYGVENKNFTKAKEYFEKAAANKEAAGFYNLGELYFKGLGVKRDVLEAKQKFVTAATGHHPKAIYKLAKMLEKGIGFKQNIVSATTLYRYVAERGPWSNLLGWALESYLKGEIGKAFLLYSRAAELGYEVAQSNAAWIIEKYGEGSMCMGESGLCTEAERHQHAHYLWWQASEQDNQHAALLIGDAYYYGRGTDRDYDRAAKAYMKAASQFNAQAMFNLGYLHEHGQGLPHDLHLAKRYYDQALKTSKAANLPVTLALMGLWIRQNYPSTFLVDLLDSLPEVYPKVIAWVESVIMDEGNVTILTLFICLLTVLYLRDRRRRRDDAIAGDIPAPLQPNDHDAPLLN